MTENNQETQESIEGESADTTSSEVVDDTPIEESGKEVADQIIPAPSGRKRRLLEEQKLTKKGWLILIFGIIVAGLVRAISVHIFVVPNNFAPGGVTGISSLLEYGTGWNAGYFLVALNLPLLIVAWIKLGKRFACVTGIAIILSSVLMVLTEKLMPNLKFAAGEDTGKRILAAIAGGIFGGVGIAIMLKIGGSSGGTDIIATIIQRKNSATNVAWFIFMLDSTVVIASAFVYKDPVPILISFIEMFVSSKVTETILQGFKSALKFEIITSHPDELSKDIMNILHRGVTAMPAKGMYTGEEKAMLVCVLRKRQLSLFREILKKYPDSFAYMSGTSEVVGRGFGS